MKRGEVSQPLEERRRTVWAIRERLSLTASSRSTIPAESNPAGLAAAPPSRFLQFLNLFGHPRALPAIVVLTALIGLPTLWVGFYADDYSLIAEIEHKVPSYAHRLPFDLYRFASDRVEVDRLIRDGPDPWFADPSSTMHFCRPLTSLVFALDHSLWGYSAVGYHLTSVLLYTALVLCVGVFFRVVLNVRGSGPAAVTATLATLVYAIEAHHMAPLAWISSRHYVVAAIPAVLGLAAHVRFVRDGWRLGAWLGPLGIVGGLLGSEAGMGAVVYWLAFDAFAPAPGRSSPRSRLLSGLPVLAITAVYVGLYSLLGFGSRGGAYFDPTKDPVGFLRAAVQRVPMLVGVSLSGIPEVAPAVAAAVFVVLGFVVVLIAYALYRLARPSLCDAERGALRWLLPGALFSLVLMAGPPSGRLVLFPSIAGAFFIAVLIYRGTQQLATVGPQLALRVGRGFLVAMHLVLAPLALVVAAIQLAGNARQESEAFYRTDFDHSAVRQVMVLAAPDLTAFYAGMVAQVLQPGPPSAWHILSMANNDHRFARTGAASFRLDVLGHAQSSSQELFRSPNTPLHVGNRVELTGAAVTVLSVNGVVPTSIDVKVDVPLDDPTLTFLTWRDGRLVRFVPPSVGASVDMPRSDGL